MDERKGIYSDPAFPAAPPERPYTYINMVATIDGKTVSGDRHESVVDLGSKTDHQLMRRLEEASDAVVIGARTLRSTSLAWSPRTEKRIVVSRSGDLPWDAAFFKETPYVATSESAAFEIPSQAQLLRAGADSVDMTLLVRALRDLGVGRLLVLGGSELNASMLQAGLVDELFLTVAPKVKLGRDIPTYAGGVALARDHLLRFELVEHHVIGNEVFLRYRQEQEA